MPMYYFGYSDADAKERFKFWLEHLPSAIALDIETISLVEKYPIGLGVAFSPYESFYFDLEPEPPRELELLIPILEDIRVLKLAHNWMFDMSVWPLLPVVGDSLNRHNIWDTNVAARLLGYAETSLPMLAMEVGMETTAAGEIMKKNSCKDMMQLHQKNPMAIAEHCQADTKVTFALYLKWMDDIAVKFPEYFNVEMQVIPILIDTSMKGILIDQAARAELSAKYGTEAEFYSNMLKGFGVQNPNSPMQIGYTLASRGNFLKMNRSKKSLSTRAGELEFLSDPMATAVLAYRKASKFKNTYLDPLEGQDRFYTEYYLDTSVGRLNSRNRNIQNIPDNARYMMLPDSGMWTTADYNREHLYILANMAQDRRLLEILYDPDPKRNDLHQFTANKMGVPRSLAKTLNFAVAYGATAQTVRERAKINDLSRCQRLIDDWFRAYPDTADWVKQTQRDGLNTGWAAPTVFGRRIKLQQESRDTMERKAVNYPVLGSDGEVFKRAVLRCNRAGIGPPSMSIFVHDSITWDGDVIKQIPVEELEHLAPFRLPVGVKQTKRWE